MGARPLRRIIEQYLEDPLAEKLLQHLNIEKRYLITVKDNAIAFIDQSTPQDGTEKGRDGSFSGLISQYV